MNLQKPILMCSKVSTRNVASFTTEQILSEKNKKICIRKFTAIKVPRSMLPTQKRKAAVLIPLCHVNNELALLYTLRSADLKRHSGQVSFPGGMCDDTDKSYTDTALRETEEELGIKREDIEVWCEGNPIPSLLRTLVTPVIGYIKNSDVIKNIKKNPQEVEEVFTVPLHVLCDPENIKYTQYSSGFSTPVFLSDSKRIWGLTGIITHMFLSSMMPKGIYTNSIKYTSPVSSKI